MEERRGRFALTLGNPKAILFYAAFLPTFIDVTRLDAGDLGLDCRYCHYTVERSGFAAVPPGQVCMNCHTKVKTDSPEIQKVVAAFKADRPVEWVKVHNLPDYAFFNHSAHVTRGISCVACHGRVDQMETVYQAKTLSMAFCLDCHRKPENHLRPVEEVTNLGWKPAAGDQTRIGQHLKEKLGIRDTAYMTSCSTCHR